MKHNPSVLTVQILDILSLNPQSPVSTAEVELSSSSYTYVSTYFGYQIAVRLHYEVFGGLDVDVASLHINSTTPGICKAYATVAHQANPALCLCISYACLLVHVSY